MMQVTPRPGGPLPRQVLPWIAIALAAAATLCAAWVVLDGALVGLATNSDTLLPSAWAETVLHEGYALHTFQLPRTTSIFPDLLIHGALQLATGSWRLASALYGWLQIAALVVAAGLIARQIAGTSYALGASVFTLLLALLFTLEAIIVADGTSHSRIVAEVAAHGGAFLLTLFAALLIVRITLGNGGRTAFVLLLVLSCLGYLSDQLTVLELDVPAVLSLAVLRRDIPRARSLAIVLALTLGAVAGEILMRSIDHQILSGNRGSLWHLIRDSSPRVVFTWYLPALAVFCVPLYGPRLQGWLEARTHNVPRRFYWNFAIAASLLCLIAAALLIYRDAGGFRYFYTLAWWPIILGAMLISAAVSGFRFAALASAAVSLALLLPQISLRPPALLTWSNRIADCLAQHRQSDRLDAGLATYWQARSINASSNWTIAMEAVTPDAGFYHWGNDRQRYLDMLGRFNFLVMQNLDPDLIAQRFGKPSKILGCPGSAIWIYPKGHMASRLDR